MAQFTATRGGVYIGAGDRMLSLPSKATIREWAEANGFADVTVWDRTELPKGPDGEPALGFAYRKIIGYSDDWDTLVQARRVAPDGVVEVPAEPAWVLDVAEAFPSGPPIAKPPPGDTFPAKPAKPGLAKSDRQIASSKVVKTVTAVVHAASAAACGYHGYKRNQSIGWSLWWSFAGAVAPIVTVPIALAQGFGQKKAR